MKTYDYFFRYDKGVTNVTPSSFLGRLFLGWFMGSNEVLKLVNRFRKWIPARMIPTTVDLFIPFSKSEEFMIWYIKEVNHFPLWCVPYKIQRNYEWISPKIFEQTQDQLFLDLAIYGLKEKDGKNYYRMFEEELMKIGGIKTLISGNYYSESEFWDIWNKENFQAVKQKTDPGNIFRDLYDKTCRASRGL